MAPGYRRRFFFKVGLLLGLSILSSRRNREGQAEIFALRCRVNLPETPSEDKAPWNRLFFNLDYSKENYLMKIAKELILITPLALLVAGCNVPARPNTTVQTWVEYGQLPKFALTPTGQRASRVYSDTTPAYPYPNPPKIVVTTDQQHNMGNDVALADAIRKHIEYDQGLAPSLERVTIGVDNDAVTLQGTVRSDLDARVIVDNLRDVDGVTVVRNDLEVDPNW